MTAPSYRTWLEWSSGHAQLFASGRAPLVLAAPRDFGGPGDVWSPEELLVGAVESCIMATFTAIAMREGLALGKCSSSAVGIIGGAPDAWSLETIYVCLSVTILREQDRAKALELATLARERSVIARSLRWPIELDTTVSTESSVERHWPAL